ncbi:MAG TPA: cation:proton antiporter [Acidobacteriota bacterium]
MSAIHNIFYDLVILFGACAVCIYFFSRFGLPTIPGFLVAGVLVGPGGLRLVRDIPTVNTLAEIGVMVLLFSLGLELSLAKLMRMRTTVFATGAAQVLLTVAVTAALARALGTSVQIAVIVGALASLSSTALVLKMLIDSQETSSIYGRVSLAILIFQDLCILPMMMVLPWMAGGIRSPVLVLWAALKALAVFALVILVGRIFFPFLLNKFAAARNKELLVVGALFLFFASTFVTGMIGFSMQIGAFLAGLMISESPYSQQVFAEFRPLRDSLNSLFFISIGMLVDPRFLLGHLPQLALLLLAGIAGKTMIVALVVWCSGFPTRVALLTGAALAQIGEFSFILVKEAQNLDLIGQDVYQFVITTSIASMIATPLVLMLARKVSQSPALSRLERIRHRHDFDDVDRIAKNLEDHVIICGFGLNGRNLADKLRQNRIPFIALDLNPDIVRKHSAAGVPIVYGDCASEEVLAHAHAAKARVIVLALSDPFLLERCVPTIRRLNPSAFLLVRTKYVEEIEALYALGASEVVAEEFEASIEIVFRTLRLYHLPRKVVAEQLRAFREHGYTTIEERPVTVSRLKLGPQIELFTEAVQIEPESAAVGKSIEESRLKANTGVLVVGLLRGDEVLSIPDSKVPLAAGDRLLLVSGKDQLKRAVRLLQEVSKN